MVRHLLAAAGMRRLLLALSLSVLTSACAQLPKAELSAYTAAFDATRTAAEPLMADYAVAERSERLIDMKEDENRGYRRGFFPTFEVGDVAALSDASLPPGAAAIDRAFNGIGRYNETLVALAENRNVDEARGQINRMIDDLSAIAPPVARMPVLKPAANFIIDNFLKPAVVLDNREQFKRIVLDARPSVKGLIATLRDYTPTQYDFQTSALQEQVKNLPPGPERDKVVEKINAWHKTYADYVALLNALDRRVDELADAVRYPKTQSFLQRAEAGAEDLRNYTDALRLSLAALRAKP